MTKKIQKISSLLVAMFFGATLYSFPIAQANSSPQFTNLPNEINLNVGDPLNLVIEASDPNNDILSFGVTPVPPGASISYLTDQSATFTYTAPGAPASFSLDFDVHDGVMGHSPTIRTVLFNIGSGSGGNQLPQFTSIPDIVTMRTRESRNIIIEASDPESDILSFNYTPAPAPHGNSSISYLSDQSATFTYTAPDYPTSFSLDFNIHDGVLGHNPIIRTVIFIIAGGGGSGGRNNPPIAVAKASPLSGNPPLEVTFDGTESEDSDGVIIFYDWDFDGDGIYDDDNSITTHTFASRGNHRVRLRAVDDDGGVGYADVNIAVGIGGSGGGGTLPRGVEVEKEVRLIGSDKFEQADTEETALPLGFNRIADVEYRISIHNDTRKTLSQLEIRDEFHGDKKVSMLNIRNIEGATYNEETKTFSIEESEVRPGEIVTFTYQATLKSKSRNALAYNSANVMKSTAADPAYVEFGRAGALNNLASLVKTADRNEAHPGELIAYQITYTNNTNSNLTNIVISDNYDERYVEIVEAEGAEDNGDRLLWRVESLDPQEVRKITYVVKIKENMTSGEIENRASMLANEGPIDTTAKVTIKILPGDPDKILPKTGASNLLLIFILTISLLASTSLLRFCKRKAESTIN